MPHPPSRTGVIPETTTVASELASVKPAWEMLLAKSRVDGRWVCRGWRGDGPELGSGALGELDFDLRT